MTLNKNKINMNTIMNVIKAQKLKSTEKTINSKAKD